jgi:hypothetical protein
MQGVSDRTPPQGSMRFLRRANAQFPCISGVLSTVAMLAPLLSAFSNDRLSMTSDIVRRPVRLLESADVEISKRHLRGYARVSTEDQVSDAKLIELKAASCDAITRYGDRRPRGPRPVLAKLLRKINACGSIVWRGLPASALRHRAVGRKGRTLPLSSRSDRYWSSTGHVFAASSRCCCSATTSADFRTD